MNISNGDSDLGREAIRMRRSIHFRWKKNFYDQETIQRPSKFEATWLSLDEFYILRKFFSV